MQQLSYCPCHMHSTVPVHAGEELPACACHGHLLQDGSFARLPCQRQSVSCEAAAAACAAPAAHHQGIPPGRSTTCRPMLRPCLALYMPLHASQRRTPGLGNTAVCTNRPETFLAMVAGMLLACGNGRGKTGKYLANTSKCKMQTGAVLGRRPKHAPCTHGAAVAGGGPLRAAAHGRHCIITQATWLMLHSWLAGTSWHREQCSARSATVVVRGHGPPRNAMGKGRVVSDWLRPNRHPATNQTSSQYPNEAAVHVRVREPGLAWPCAQSHVGQWVGMENAPQLLPPWSTSPPHAPRLVPASSPGHGWAWQRVRLSRHPHGLPAHNGPRTLPPSCVRASPALELGLAALGALHRVRTGRVRCVVKGS